MHRMVAIGGKSADDCIHGGGTRGHAVGRDRVAYDPLRDRVALFGEERTLVNANPGSAAILVLRVGTESLDDVRFPIFVGIAKRDQETAGMRRALIILAAPCVDVDVAIGSNDDMPGVSECVGEYCRAETVG